MKRLVLAPLLALLLLVGLPRPAAATYTYLGVHVAASSNTGNTVTTGAINTTGANLLIMAVGTYNLNHCTPSDSSSNTWTALTESHEAVGDSSATIYYVVSPTTNASHTFSCTGAGTYSSIAIAAFSGAHATPFDQQNGASGTATNTLATGSITPTQSDELIIAIGGWQSSLETWSVDSGMTITDQMPYGAGSNYGVGLSYKIQNAAAAINVTEDWETGGAKASIRIASFKAAVLGGGGGATTRQLMLTGVGP